MISLAYARPGCRAGDAEAAFRRSIELAPDDPWNHVYLAHLFYAQRLYDESLTAARRAHELAPKLDMPLIVMADVYARLRDYRQADACFRKAVEVDPHSDLRHSRLARWLAFWVPEQERRPIAAAEGVVGKQPRRRTREQSSEE
jgi:tetratricopeptide (TPR) repeat protein